MNTRNWVRLLEHILSRLRGHIERLEQVEASEREREESAAAVADEWRESRGLPSDPEQPDAASESPETVAVAVELFDEEIESRRAAGALVSEIDDFAEELTVREEIRRFAVALERWTRQKNW